MGEPTSWAAGFWQTWIKWFGIGLGADAVLLGIMWLMVRYGGMGDIGNPWAVVVILVVGTAGFATRKAMRIGPRQDAPPPVAVASVGAPLPRDRKGR